MFVDAEIVTRYNENKSESRLGFSESRESFVGRLRAYLIHELPILKFINSNLYDRNRHLRLIQLCIYRTTTICLNRN
jgi:hypothetical protein